MDMDLDDDGYRYRYRNVHGQSRSSDHRTYGYEQLNCFIFQELGKELPLLCIRPIKSVSILCKCGVQ